MPSKACASVLAASMPTSSSARTLPAILPAVSLAVGVGIAIPILDEEMAFFTGVSDAEIPAPIVDYSSDYPEMSGNILGRTNYRDLRSGEIELMGKKVRTVSLSSYSKARKIAIELKKRIKDGSFRLTEPVAPLME